MKKEFSEKTLIVDIGTAFVTGGIISAGKDRLPHVGKTQRFPLSTGTEISKEGLEAILGESLKALSSAYHKESFKHIRVVLAAPWKSARIRSIFSRSDKPVTISERTILRAVSDYKNEAPPESGNIDVEAVAVQVKVNGYPTPLTKNVTGKNLAIQFYESEAGAKIVNLMQAALHGAFPNAAITFHTFPLVSTVALRGLSQEPSFMVVDCAGEATEITVVHEDAIQFLSSFPLGYYGVARAFAGKNGGIGDALSRLLLLARGELRDEDRNAALKKFTAALAPWKTQFAESLAQAAEVAPIPRTLYFISDREPLVWMRPAFEGEHLSGISIEVVTAPLVQNMITLGESGTYDIFISLAAIFFHMYRSNLIGEQR